MPCCNTAPYKRLQCVLCRPCNYTTNAAKQRTGIYRCFSCDCTRSAAHDTRPTQAAIIPPAPRWSVSQRRNTSSTYQNKRYARTLYRSAQPPIIIMYIRGCSIQQTMPARRGLDASHARLKPWHRVSLALAWHTSGIMFSSWHGRRGTTGGLRRSSFRAFAR